MAYVTSMKPVEEPSRAALALDEAIRCACQEGHRALAERLFRISSHLSAPVTMVVTHTVPVNRLEIH
jgi:hypothetical protein